MFRDGPPDHRRLEAALERFGRLLEATARRSCPPHLGIDTQDVVQEARLRLWRFLSRATEAELTSSYVYKVAATAAIDAMRAAAARREEQLAAPPRREESDEPQGFEPTSDPRQSPEADARRRELATMIEDALRQLSEVRRRAVRFHLWGLSSPDISRLTGWSETKTRSLVSRGLRDLRRHLAQRGVDRDAGS